MTKARRLLEKEMHFVTDGMDPLVADIDKASRRKDSVLILGESGTGKSMVARAIEVMKKHYGESGTMVEMNCAATPETLIESKLFGHEAGSFTDAKKAHRGVLEMAHKGRLFLDEIGELPHSAQAKLLRVMEDGDVEKVGAEHTTHVDVQILAATSSSNIGGQRSAIRNELYYRLSANTIVIPPFRDRPAEAKRHLIHNAFENAPRKVLFTEKASAQIDPDVIESLSEQPFPGNVRQLINVATNVYAQAAYEQLHGSGEEKVVRIGMEHAQQQLSLLQEKPVSNLDHSVPFSGEEKLGDVQDRLMVYMVRNALGQLAGAASSSREVSKILGISNSTLDRNLKRIAIERGVIVKGDQFHFSQIFTYILDQTE